MNFEEAICLIESALAPEQLTALQKNILHHVWNGESYVKMSYDLQYNHGYIKDVGAGLWRLLSDVLGEKVRKHNLRTALARYQQRQATAESASSRALTLLISQPGDSSRLDNAKVTDLEQYIESRGNVSTLSQRILQDPRPVVAIFDVGGASEITSEARMADQLSHSQNYGQEFPLEHPLQDVFKALEPRLQSTITSRSETVITDLLELLSQKSCLLIVAS